MERVAEGRGGRLVHMLLGAGLLAGGWLVGRLGDPGSGTAVAAEGVGVVAPGESDPAVASGEALEELAREVAALRGELEVRLARGAGEAALERRVRALEGSGARRPVAAGGDDGLLEAAVLSRLERLEAAMEEWRVVVDRAGSRVQPLRVTRMDVDRETLYALNEQSDDEGDEGTTAMHLFWSYQDVLDRYGPPDKVETFDEHLEFVYTLEDPSGEQVQFDFHFIDGFCVTAH